MAQWFAEAAQVDITRQRIIWTWRAKPGFVTEELVERIMETGKRCGRI